MATYIMIVFGMYIVVSVVNIWGRYKGDDRNNYVTKPLLMPLLAIGYILASGSNVSWVVVAALVFCTLGDVFLMLPEKKKGELRWFFRGLFSFMLGHLCYFTWYLMYTRDSGFTWAWVAGLLVALLAIAGVAVILKKLEAGHLIPFVLYTAAIMLNVTGAIGTWGTGPIPGTLLCTLGALLFCISDSMIALNVLDNPIGSGGAVMITYTLAQLMLIIGIIALSSV